MKFEKTLILFGILLRIYLFTLNPPNNTYDNHLEVINKYSLGAHVKLEECWECYQPPLYYNITGSILSISYNLGFSDLICWKIVQGFNVFLSILVLLLFYKMLKNETIKPIYRILFISLWIVFPRDLLASIMITNDYALVFITTLIFYLLSIFLKENSETKKWWILYLLIFMLSSIAGLVKQSGLVLLFIPGLLTLKNLMTFKNKNYKIGFLVLLLVAICISLSSEYANHKNGYKFLVSAQDFLKVPLDQHPGDINKIEFYNLKYIDLMKAPFFSDETIYSFNTELFASTWFDYDQKYALPSNLSRNSARYSYSLGILWVLFFLIISLIKFKNTKLNFSINSISNYFNIETFIICLLIVFYIVPLLQTFRYPFYSSMKAQFMLPAFPAILLLFAKMMNTIKINQKVIYFIVSLNLILMIFMCLYIYEGTTYGLNKEHGVILFELPDLK